MGKKTNRIVGFDIIRLIACFFVCIVHFNASLSGYQNGVFLYDNNIVPNFILGNRVHLGTLGVNLFFIVSGASLMLSYQPGDKVTGFYRKRILNIYPTFWVAFAFATFFDFFRYKAMANAQPFNLAVSFAGLDGYLSVLGLIPWEYYKIGEWFLGCIILMYIMLPLVNWFLMRFPKAACGCFGVLYLFSLYAISRQIPYLGASTGITICACEMFLGMAYIRFGLHQKKKTIYAAMAVFILAIILRNKMPADFLTLAFACFILESVMILSDKIQSSAVKQKLLFASSLTYPIFLVHHFLSDRMVLGFDLANMPRMYVYVLFAFFIAGTLLLAAGLKNLGDRFSCWIRRNESVMVSIIVMLLLSYGYTIFRVIQHQLAY